jgi:hypothetical protein
VTASVDRFRLEGGAGTQGRVSSTQGPGVLTESTAIELPLAGRLHRPATPAAPEAYSRERAIVRPSACLRAGAAVEVMASVGPLLQPPVWPVAFH